MTRPPPRSIMIVGLISSPRIASADWRQQAAIERALAKAQEAGPALHCEPMHVASPCDFRSAACGGCGSLWRRAV